MSDAVGRRPGFGVSTCLNVKAAYRTILKSPANPRQDAHKGVLHPALFLKTLLFKRDSLGAFFLSDLNMAAATAETADSRAGEPY